jgi:N-carbamoyl-L-amino-acid hydrolase
MADIEIDGARVLADLTALRGIGTYKTGVHRPTLSRDHLQSIAWLEAKLLAAGLDAHVDGIGNVLGRSRVGGAKLLAGSHLESQNHAGWLDGPLGVIYALEAARVINGATSGALAGKAVEVAAWCDEEGHFTGMLGSRSYVGELSDEEIDWLTDFTDGRRLRDALSAAGLAGRPRMACEDGRHIGFIEAHIEQGDWLESRDLKIGIVTSIVAIWQYRIIFEGVQNHAGTTRMAIRKERLDARLAAVVAEADARGPCHVTLEATRKGTPARMSEPFQAALEAVAERHAPGRAVRMPSGAIHDAQRLATRMPAGMLFVPSIGGISHHWSEDTSDADIVLGAQVFANWAAALLVAA